MSSRRPKMRKQTVIRTVRAVLPDPDSGKHFFRVTTPSGDVVTVGVIASRGQGNKCVLMTVRYPKGSQVERGENIKRRAEPEGTT